MGDNLPVVWSAKEHTLAKHRILTAYLQRWMLILAGKQLKSAAGGIYGTLTPSAGPGIYDDGSKGSPLLALETALNLDKRFPYPVRLTFIEDDEERLAILKQQILLYRDRLASAPNVRLDEPLQGDCVPILHDMLARFDAAQNPFGPAMVFLDQFGYSAVPMALVGRIMEHPQCEVLTFFFWKDLDRFITDANKHPAISRAFGSDEWRPAITMSGDERHRYMFNLYLQAMRSQGNSQFVWPFVMYDESNRILCWLVFGSNNLRGLEEMKKAMWEVDRSGGFRFSDADGLAQPSLFAALKSGEEVELADTLNTKLGGNKLTVDAINLIVLTETPFYKFKDTLGQMKRNGRVRIVNASSARGTVSFADGSTQVYFEPKEFGGLFG